MTTHNHVYIPTGALVFETLNTTAISIRLSVSDEIENCNRDHATYLSTVVPRPAEVKSEIRRLQTPQIYREWSHIQNRFSTYSLLCTCGCLRLGPCERLKIDLFVSCHLAPPLSESKIPSWLQTSLERRLAQSRLAVSSFFSF
jgi:hypothetical protein